MSAAIEVARNWVPGEYLRALAAMESEGAISPAAAGTGRAASRPPRGTILIEHDDAEVMRHLQGAYLAAGYETEVTPGWQRRLALRSL